METGNTDAQTLALKISKYSFGKGETGCKTPDAKAYIKKALSRKR
jgi:hypothetical protein